MATPTPSVTEDGEYPTVYIERPLTLPALMTEASLRFRYWWVDDEENVATTRVTASLGLTDWWQASATTRWFVAPEREWGEVVTVASRVQALDTARVAVAPDLEVSILFDGDRNTEAIPAVSVGALARIRILKRSALYVGDDVATFGLRDDGYASVDLNAAFVSQFSDHLAISLGTRLVHIRLFGDIGESGGPYLPAVSLIASPASWIDYWLGFQYGSSSDGLIAGIAARL
ncbi:MAG TPA: hypothetical protein VIG06_17450 [Kofleriaceae bacterium]